jgi:hypothetical protein
MSEEHPEYLAYLLRMWRVPEDGGAHWRASLERPGDDHRIAFTDLEEAFEFLRWQASETARGLPAAGDPHTPAD